ncbi:ArsR/SmtB family transcription factor [Tessaracoccus coleopterorum]|uniref:ArsR/SmtB family transcription factor n=1 Tax=Tessaracoccus coleopterorum TaxID=2714950 RepID=UPI0038CD9EBD
MRLLRYLADSATGTVCACHLPDALGITQPTLSFHMRKLHDAGLVEREQRGRWAHWSINAEALVPIRSFLNLDGPARAAPAAEPAYLRPSVRRTSCHTASSDRSARAGGPRPTSPSRPPPPASSPRRPADQPNG